MTAALDHIPTAIAADLRTIANAGRVARGLRAILGALLNRREVDRLYTLTDRELADIGLFRADLIVVSRSPLGVDPTRQLTSLVHERFRIEEAARRVG